MKKSIILISLAIAAVLIIFFYPKDAGGGTCGLCAPGAYKWEERSCLGIKQIFYPGCCDIPSRLLCYGIAYGENVCYNSSDSPRTVVSCEQNHSSGTKNIVEAKNIVEDFNYTVMETSNYVEPTGNVTFVGNKVYFTAYIYRPTPCNTLDISYTAERSDSENIIKIKMNTPTVVEPDSGVVCPEVIIPVRVNGSFTSSSMNTDVSLIFNGNIIVHVAQVPS